MNKQCRVGKQPYKAKIAGEELKAKVAGDELKAKVAGEESRWGGPKAKVAR